MTAAIAATPSLAAERRRLAWAVGLAALIVAAAPAAGVARSWLQAALGPRFAAWLLGALALVVAAATLGGLRHATRPSPGRLARAAAALGLAAAYVSWTGSADPAIRAVELVHFVEYGVITFLFHRAWRDRAGTAVFGLAGIAAFLAGLTEEAYQWWLPARVGELKDVWLNGVAIGCGLLFISGITPETARRVWPAAASRTAMRLLAVTVVALAAFIHAVHLGTPVTHGTTSFVSRFTVEALAAAARDRAARWASAPPLVRPDRLSREDQYATEGLQHVQARNTAWSAGDAVTAWHENQILERHFAPVLDAPSYLSRSGHRWAADHLAEVQRRAGPGTAAPFESRAFPYPLYPWPPAALWVAALALAAACWWAGERAVRA